MHTKDMKICRQLCDFVAMSDEILDPIVDLKCQKWLTTNPITFSRLCCRRHQETQSVKIMSILVLPCVSTAVPLLKHQLITSNCGIKYNKDQQKINELVGLNGFGLLFLSLCLDLNPFSTYNVILLIMQTSSWCHLTTFKTAFLSFSMHLNSFLVMSSYKNHVFMTC